MVNIVACECPGRGTRPSWHLAARQRRQWIYHCCQCEQPNNGYEYLGSCCLEQFFFILSLLSMRTTKQWLWVFGALLFGTILFYFIIAVNANNQTMVLSIWGPSVWNTQFRNVKYSGLVTSWCKENHPKKTMQHWDFQAIFKIASWPVNCCSFH